MAGPARNQPNPDITPDRQNLRRVGTISDSGGPRAHGPGSQQALTSNRSHKQRVGYTYLYSIIDQLPRLANGEVLEGVQAATPIGSSPPYRRTSQPEASPTAARLVIGNGPATILLRSQPRSKDLSVGTNAPANTRYDTTSK